MKQYSEMLEEAKNAGLTNEKIMWKSIAGVSEMLQLVKRDHPEMYWEFMREQHGILYGNHYNESFAIHDVSMIRYTDRMGKKCEGPYWTLEQIESATKGMAYPAGTTKWDKYVAFNGFYADTCTVLEEEQIIKAAHKFYFMDEDAPQGKIWLYMEAIYDAK
jgi:hypothetical protein